MTRYLIAKLRWLLLPVVLAGCTTINVSLPAITDNPVAPQAGRVIWHDLLTNDIAASRAFYEQLFGWQFEELPLSLGVGKSSKYLLIRNNGKLIGGMVDTSKLGDTANSSQWIAVMSAADVVAATRQVVEAGGKVLTQPSDLQERGTIAVVEDSSGAVFALLQTRLGDPADQPARPGDFFWDEVWTDDISKAAAFYKELAPFEDVSRPTGEGRYQALATAGSPSFGLLQEPIPGLKPTWASYIKVADMSILDKVEAAGGRVALPAEQRPLGGEVALILGPSGAGVALQTWPDEE